MDIITTGHEAKNAVMQIMQLFFALSDDVRVVSTLKFDGNLKIAQAVITAGGRSATGEAVTESCDKLYITNTIKKSVFYAGKQLSDMPTPWGISTGIRPAKTARKLIEKGFDDKAVVSHMKNEYLVGDNKARLTLEVAKREKAILDSIGKNTVSIYVGIPFCPSRCSYCSFISQATEHNNKFIEPYVDAVVTEIDYSAEIIKKLNMQVDTVYFGGGTPTAIKPYLLEKIIDRLHNKMDLSKEREFTVEAGRPDTFSPEMMSMLAKTMWAE